MPEPRQNRWRGDGRLSAQTAHRPPQDNKEQAFPLHTCAVHCCEVGGFLQRYFRTLCVERECEDGKQTRAKVSRYAML